MSSTSPSLECNDLCQLSKEDFLCHVPKAAQSNLSQDSDDHFFVSFGLSDDCLGILLDMSHVETHNVIFETEYVRDTGAVRRLDEWYENARLGNRSTRNVERWDRFESQVGNLDGIGRSLKMLVGWSQERIDQLTPRLIYTMFATTPDQSPFPMNFTTGHILHLNGLDHLAGFYAELKFKYHPSIFWMKVEETEANLQTMETKYSFDTTELMSSFEDCHCFYV